MTLKSILKFVVSFSILSNMPFSVYSSDEQNQKLIINPKWQEERNQRKLHNQELSGEDSQEEDYQELRSATEQKIRQHLGLALFPSESARKDWASNSWKKFYTTHPKDSQPLPEGYRYNKKGDIVPIK